MEILLHGFRVSRKDPVPIHYNGLAFYVFWFTSALKKVFLAPHTVVFSSEYHYEFKNWER